MTLNEAELKDYKDKKQALESLINEIDLHIRIADDEDNRGYAVTETIALTNAGNSNSNLVTTFNAYKQALKTILP